MGRAKRNPSYELGKNSVDRQQASRPVGPTKEAQQSVASAASAVGLRSSALRCILAQSGSLGTSQAQRRPPANRSHRSLDAVGAGVAGLAVVEDDRAALEPGRDRECPDLEAGAGEVVADQLAPLRAGGGRR